MDELERKRMLQKSYMRSFRRGRSLFAYFTDSIAVFAVVGILIYLSVKTHFRNGTAAAFVSAVCFALFAVIRHIVRGFRFDRHAANMRRNAESSLRRQKLLLHYGELMSFADADEYHIVKSVESITADEVLSAYAAGKKKLFAVGMQTEKAEELINALGMQVVSPQDVAAENAAESVLAVSEDEIDEALIKAGKSKKPMSVKAFIGSALMLSNERAVRLFCTGAALTLLSFAVRYGIYYRIIGAVCLSLAGTVFCIENVKVSRKDEDRLGTKS